MSGYIYISIILHAACKSCSSLARYRCTKAWFHGRFLRRNAKHFARNELGACAVGLREKKIRFTSEYSKGIPNGFPCRITWSVHEGCRETFGKRKNTRAAGECYAFRKSSNIPNAWITLSCLENHLVIVL